MYCRSFPDKKQFKKIGDARTVALKLTLSQKEEVSYYYCKSCFKYHVGRTGFITNSTYKRSLKPKPAIKIIGKIELPSPKAKSSRKNPNTKEK